MLDNGSFPFFLAGAKLELVRSRRILPQASPTARQSTETTENNGKSDERFHLRFLSLRFHLNSRWLYKHTEICSFYVI